MADNPAVPSFVEFIEPTVAALRDAGGALDNEKINTRVFAAMGLSPEALAVRHDERLSEAEYRAYWARSYLSLAGVLRSPGRATWALAPDAPSSIDAREVVRSVRAARRAAAERRAPLEQLANAPEV